MSTMVDDASAWATYSGVREMDEQQARAPWLGDAVCRSLGLGLLTEGVRSAGRAACQLRFGRLCVLVVRLAPQEYPQSPDEQLPYQWLSDRSAKRKGKGGKGC